MMREFEILYREQRELTMGEAQAAQAPVKISANGLAPFGPILPALRVAAAVEQEARAVIESQGFFIVRIKNLGPVIEPGQNWFRVEEACKYIGCGKTALYDAINEGRLSKQENRDPLFSRKDLDRVAAEGIGKKKKAKKLKFQKAA